MNHDPTGQLADLVTDQVAFVAQTFGIKPPALVVSDDVNDARYDPATKSLLWSPAWADGIARRFRPDHDVALVVILGVLVREIVKHMPADGRRSDLPGGRRRRRR